MGGAVMRGCHESEWAAHPSRRGGPMILFACLLAFVAGNACRRAAPPAAARRRRHWMSRAGRTRPNCSWNIRRSSPESRPASPST
jgi:hypothetical protein